MADVKNPTDVLFHAELAEREWGSALLSVAKLTAWTNDKGIELVTVPPLTGYRFVQAEALLCAIQSGANSLTPEQAAEIVQADPVLSKHGAVTDPEGYIDPISCRWLLGADAHLSWRRLLENAIEKQELTLLNFGSKLPIQAPSDTQPQATPEPAPTPWHLLATPAELIVAFESLTGMNKAWFNNAKDAPKLKAALYSAGQGGRNGREPLYFVFPIMQWLIDPKRRKGTTMKEATGWRVLRNKFPKVYEDYQGVAPDFD